MRILNAPPVLLALFLSLALMLSACGPKLPPLEEVPAPELQGAEPTVAEQVAEARGKIESSKRRGEARTVADAYGGLGETYQAYGLVEPADVAYRNAEKLDPASFAWPYYRGLLAQEAGDFEAARDHFARALELRSSSVPAHLRLGEVLLALGDAEAAREQFAAAEAKEPAAAAYGLGRVAASLGELDVARTELEKALSAAPGSGAVAHALNDVKRRSGETVAADSTGSAPPAFDDPLAKRLEGLAVSGGALLRRGNQALMAGRLDDAVGLFERGVETAPENLELRLNLAETMRRAGRLDEASGVLRRALEDLEGGEPSQIARVHHDLGNMLLMGGDAESAATELERAIALQPDYLEAHFNLANVYGQLERWPAVRESAAKVLELDPSHTRARYLQAMSRFRAGQRQRAEAELRRLVDSDPTELAFREGLATVLAESRRATEAAAVVRLEEPPGEMSDEDRLRLLRFGAPLVWRRGDRPTAIELWREAAELEPSSRSMTDLANGLQLVGERGAALELFGRAADLAPENATAWLSEASLLILDGQLQRASERLGQAMRLHPQHPGLANIYARLLATAPDASLRNGRLAVQLARLAYGVELSIEYGETLAMALAEFGNFEQAINVQRRIAQQAQIAGDRIALRRLVTNLKRYENRLPVRLAGAE